MPGAYRRRPSTNGDPNVPWPAKGAGAYRPAVSRTAPRSPTSVLADAPLRREREFSAALMAAVDALVVVLDPEGRIVRFNRASEKVSGYRAEQVVGTFL